MPSSGAKSAKRWFGVGLILLLTPPTVAVAIVTTSAASRWASGPSPLLLTVTVPLVVLTLLMWWAAAIHRPQARKQPQDGMSRTALLLATPAVVGGATAVGFLLAGLIFSLASHAQRGLSTNGTIVGLVAFILVPGIALFAMLWTAWRAD